MTPDDSEPSDNGTDVDAPGTVPGGARATTNIAVVERAATRLAVAVTSTSGVVWAQRIVTALSVVVPLWMLRTILGENRFSTLDYWDMVAQVYEDDGSLRLAGFLEHQNDHLVALPKIVIVANVALFDGSRVTLGVFVWLVAAAMTIVIARTLRHSVGVTGWGRVVAVWALVLATFPVAAQHNFRLAVSGTAWTFANLLMVCAVVLATRSRSLVAGAAGVAATFTYGTGLAVWPALVLVLALKRRFTRADALMLVMGAVAVVIERATAVTAGSRAPVSTWVPTHARNVLLTIGELFTDGPPTALLVGTAVVAVALFAIHRRRGHWVDDAGVIGLATLAFTGTSLVLIALSRGVFGDAAFAASRYMGVAALFTLGVGVISVLAWGDTPVVRGVAIVLAASSLLSTRAITDNLDDFSRRITVGEVAAYMGVAEGIVPLYRYAEESARSLGHVPFDGSFDADCGTWGGSVTPDPGDPPSGVAGEVGPPEATRNREALEVTGWMTGDVDCVVVIDESDQVVGILATGMPNPGATPDDVPATSGLDGLVLRQHDGTLRVVVRPAGATTFVEIATVPDAKKADR